MSNFLDLDEERHSIGPDLGPNFLQSLSADQTICSCQGKNCYRCLKNTLKMEGIILKVLEICFKSTGKTLQGLFSVRLIPDNAI